MGYYARKKGFYLECYEILIILCLDPERQGKRFLERLQEL
jgi:hypothetical protein